MVTIKDVARLAGVSIATVSRTLSKPDSVAETTRARVMKAVTKSGYVTNALASNFRRRQTNNVVVLVPDISNPFYAAVIQGIEIRAMDAGYRILLGDTLHNREREKAYAQLVRQRQADGLICLGREIPADHESREKSPDEVLPVVMACEYSGPLKVPSVVIDNVQAAREIVQHLLELGHTSIGFINGPAESPLCEDRLLGYKGTLKAAKIGLKGSLVDGGDFTLASGYAAAQRLLKQRDKPTALFCACDEMAIGAMHAARDMGLEIPGDLAIAGFDDIDAAAYAYPPLTTVRQPRSEIGQTAMALMLEALGDRPSTPRQVILPHELVLRASTVAAD